jgi:microcystin-dependent protein
MFINSYIGIVVPFAGNFAPQNWLFCRGQVLPISENEALFTLLGTTYGGDGINTFVLPNLTGRVAIHSGQGAQMQYYIPGQIGGSEKVSIALSNLPVHTHALTAPITGNPACSDSAGTTSAPENNYPAIINGGAAEYSTSASDAISMGGAAVTTPTPLAPVVNGEQKVPIDTMSPFLAMNYIICVAGIFPPRG